MDWTIKDAGSGENLSAAEREEAVLEQVEQSQEETYQTPQNEGGDWQVNLDQPPTQEEDAIQERETTEISLEEQPGDSAPVDEEVRVESDQETSERPPAAEFEIEQVVEEPEPEPTPVADQVLEQEPVAQVPENLQALVDFMNDTGGSVEDFVNLNRDITNMSPVDTIKEYYRQKYPHYDEGRIDRKMNKAFLYDQEGDEPETIQEKQDAFQDELYEARQYLNDRKEKYFKELKAPNRSLSPEVQDAVQFYNDNKAQEERTKQITDNFHKATEQVFNQDFKGFDFNVGDNKFRVKVGDVKGTMTHQKDLSNFINQFVTDEGNVKDVAEYHKALYVARNADRFAQHFYEQGRADAIKQSAAEAKNIDMQPRQDAASVVTPTGQKFRVVSGTNSNGLKIKMRQ